MQLAVRSSFQSRSFAAAILLGCKNPIMPPFLNHLAHSLPFSFSFWKWRLGFILLLYPVTLSIGLSPPSFLHFWRPSNFLRWRDRWQQDRRRRSEFPAAAFCSSSLFFSCFLPSLFVLCFFHLIPLFYLLFLPFYLFIFPLYFLFSLRTWYLCIGLMVIVCF